MKNKPIEIHPIEAECQYCHKIRPMASLRHLGNGTYECVKSCGKAYHKPSTKQRVWDQHEQEKVSRKWIISGECSFRIEIEEVRG